MVSVVYERGFAGASVASVCARAKVSHRSFYEAFEGREACFLAVLDEGYWQTREVISQAFEQAESWRDGVQAALAGLLVLFDTQPRLARVWLIESLAGGGWALERREQNIAALRRMIVEYWRPPAGAGSHPLAAAGVMAAVLGIIQAHLITARQEPLVTLLGPLMGLATAPYLDTHGVLHEVERGAALAQRLVGAPRTSESPYRPHGFELPAVLGNPNAHRARRCVLHLAEHPGCSNSEVASAVGITSHAQASMLLARLARAGLLLKQPGRPGQANAWSLTPQGGHAAQALTHETFGYSRPF
jgi:AcrR family transcriptional regulator